MDPEWPCLHKTSSALVTSVSGCPRHTADPVEGHPAALLSPYCGQDFLGTELETRSVALAHFHICLTAWHKPLGTLFACRILKLSENLGPRGNRQRSRPRPQHFPSPSLMTQLVQGILSSQLCSALSSGDFYSPHKYWPHNGFPGSTATFPCSQACKQSFSG